MSNMAVVQQVPTTNERTRSGQWGIAGYSYQLGGQTPMD